MLYNFLLIFNLIIDSCYSTHAIVQCCNWLTDFTKIIAFHNGYKLYNQPRVPILILLMHSNTPYCYCKIACFKTITVAQYTRTVLLVFITRL